MPAPAAPAAAGGEGGDAAPPQPPFQRVVRLYANAFLHTGTPLHTMALAFSGQAGGAIKHGGKILGGGAGGPGAVGRAGAAEAGKGQGGGFEDSWTVTAAAIISNKVHLRRWYRFRFWQFASFFSVSTRERGARLLACGSSGWAALCRFM